MSELELIRNDAGQTIGCVIGEIAGEQIKLVLSDKSAVDGIDQCLHLIAAPVNQKEMTMQDALDAGIGSGAVIDLVRAMFPEWLPLFMPGKSVFVPTKNRDGEDWEQMDFRAETNGPGMANMDAPHCHIILAPVKLGRTGFFRRCVDPIRAVVPATWLDRLKSLFGLGTLLKYKE